jgi:hypothetical protein
VSIVIDSSGEFANRNWVNVPAPNNQQMWTFTGNAVFSFRGQSETSWRYEELIILPPESPNFGRISQWAYSAAPSSIFNAGPANSAGWAVDDVNLYANPGRAGIRCTIAVRDTDGYLFRVAYNIFIVGTPA